MRGPSFVQNKDYSRNPYIAAREIRSNRKRRLLQIAKWEPGQDQEAN